MFGAPMTPMRPMRREGGGLHRATPPLTRGFGFCGLIRRTSVAFRDKKGLLRTYFYQDSHEKKHACRFDEMSYVLTNNMHEKQFNERGDWHALLLIKRIFVALISTNETM